MKNAMLFSLLLHGVVAKVLNKDISSAQNLAPRMVELNLLEKKKIKTVPTTPAVSRVVPSSQSVSSFEPKVDFNPMRPSPPEEDLSVTLSGGDFQPAPEYPAAALENEMEGEVLLEVETDAQGFVSDIRIQKSSGHYLLDEEALSTVKKWQMKPSTKVLVPIRFQLSTIDVS